MVYIYINISILLSHDKLSSKMKMLEKDSCYSSLLSASPFEIEDSHQVAFGFQIFKAHGQDASEQVYLKNAH